MSDIHIIKDAPLDLQTLHDIIRSERKIRLSAVSEKKITACRLYLEKRLRDRDRPFYGINTGFGSLHNVKISDENLSKLQRNLMLSHACGTGGYVPLEIVKIMLWSKIRSLSFGHSGVQLETVQRLIDFYNNDLFPVVYTQGSLGASGDLAPLAHLCLPLIGEGEVWLDGEITSAKTVLERFGWQPIELKSKEGLALLNGTQFMSAYGIYALFEARKYSYLADVIASTSLDAYNGSLEPFYDLVHLVRPHNGQISTARRVRKILDGSELMAKPKLNVQDPYSFRCIPQVHGATKDTIAYAERIFITEINSVTDNPNIFAADDEIISGGNFHGQPLAFAFDFLKIALSELGNISERRTFQLVSGQRGLPDFLVDNPGLNSGLMIPQYTAASIVSANKQLATPASIDSIVSSNGQEDHVSMGANAAVQTIDLINNLKQILAIELLNASQALFFRSPKKSSPFIENLLKTFRKEVPFISEDQFLRDDIAKSISFLSCINLDNESLFD
ncbi:MAG: histidine ammonia-lyase [Flavobacteriaceae bacterium]|nr:histidine ammonia-lyase [Flavobacteriaceae bacterium]